MLARISRRELTRIAVDRGQVRRITANPGDFVIEKDEERGQVYLRPTQADSSRPIQLYLSADQGTVGLLLQPLDIPGDTLLVRLPTPPRASAGLREGDARGPASPATEATEANEATATNGPAAERRTPAQRRAERHVRALKSLLLTMADNRHDPELDLRESGVSQALWLDTRLTLERVWVGAHLVGERYRLANLGERPIGVPEADLIRPGVMAISVEQATLQPGEATDLFLIRERRRDD